MKKIILAVLVAAMAVPFQISAADRDKASTVTVISYNIRNGEAKDGTNSWTYRYPASAMMIADQDPDIFGLQEAYDYQVEYLEEYCPGYASVGVGREDGKHEGEHMSIFYKKKRVSLLKWGTFWLSETPDEPSMGWDAACKRSATWALMKHKESGRKFFYVNTHLDHVGVEARKNGLKLIVDKIAEMNPEGLPMVLTADFNISTSEPEFNELKTVMLDARETAVKTDHKATYNGWGKSESESMIDHIWYKGFSSCTEFQTVTKEYMDRKFISDHFPVKATLVF